MRLQKLSFIDALRIYKTQLYRDFRVQEIKSWQKIAPLAQNGLYHGYGLFDGDELVAYGFLCGTQPGGCLLLDYCAVRAEYRNKGYGSLFIKMLTEICVHNDLTMVIEVKSPGSSSTAEECELCARRIHFYESCGMLPTKLITSLPGCSYRVMYKPCAGLRPESSIRAALIHLYAKLFCEDIHGNALQPVSAVV